jgi:hypothetical protein
MGGLGLEPQPADVRDCDGAPVVLHLSRRSFPFIAKAFGDMGFAGRGLRPRHVIVETVGDRSIRLGSRFTRAGGSWSDFSPELAATGDSGRAQGRPSPRPEPSSMPLTESTSGPDGKGGSLRGVDRSWPNTEQAKHRVQPFSSRPATATRINGSERHQPLKCCYIGSREESCHGS